MKENYFDHVNRIQTLIQHRACFPPADEEFKTSPNLVQKCREDGSICPFYGDTVVFQLPKRMKQYLNITVRRSRQSGVARATCPD